MKIPMKKNYLFLIYILLPLSIITFLAWFFPVKAQTPNTYLYLNGNVGIGTANPQASLDVEGTGGSLKLQKTGSTGNIQFRGGSDGGSSSSMYMYNSSGILSTVISDGTYSSFFSGNVGLGTASPISELHVKQKGVSAYQNGITLENPAGQRGVIVLGGDQRLYLFSASGYMTVNTGGYVTSTGGFGAESSRSIKENFTPLDKTAILQKIDQLPVEQWNYKSQNPSLKHINTFAEDFYNAFGLNGTDNKTINLTDETGITLAGVQALSAQVNEQHKEIEELKAEIRDLKNSK
jgi:hypothetical protein